MLDRTPCSLPPVPTVVEWRHYGDYRGADDAVMCTSFHTCYTTCRSAPPTNSLRLNECSRDRSVSLVEGTQYRYRSRPKVSVSEVSVNCGIGLTLPSTCTDCILFCIDSACSIAEITGKMDATLTLGGRRFAYSLSPHRSTIMGLLTFSSCHMVVSFQLLDITISCEPMNMSLPDCYYAVL